MQNKIFTAACIQLNTGNNLQANILRAAELIREAKAKGAVFVTCPENIFFMSAKPGEGLANAYKMEEHPGVSALQKLALELKIWVLFCACVKTGTEKKLFNRSILVDPKGEIASYYDKIHLFDAEVPNGESHRESDHVIAGSKIVVTDLGFAKLGMTICYDMRFPGLFRILANNGAQIITAPSAFTYKTGEVHWHILLRARAIENSCYIIAPGQCGIHPSGRQTYGHSLIIDPWGKILAEASEGSEEVITAEIDLDYLEKIRTALPGWQFDQAFN